MRQVVVPVSAGRRVYPITRCIAGIPVNERFHEEKLHDTRYSRVSSLVINFFKFVDHRNYTWACRKSTCALRACFLRAFFFSRVIQGGPLVQSADHPWFSPACPLDAAEKTCISERQMTGWNKYCIRKFHFEDTSFDCFFPSYYYGY